MSLLSATAPPLPFIMWTCWHGQASVGECGSTHRTTGIILHPSPCWIRPADPQDADRVAEVLVSSRRTFLPFAPLVHSQADVAGWLRDERIPAGGVSVAEDKSVILAMMDVGEVSGVTWIHQLYVSPACVGRGIGERLLLQTMAIAETPLRLYTFQANERARSFYERHGFKAVRFSEGEGNEERCPDVLYERPVLSWANPPEPLSEAAAALVRLKPTLPALLGFVNAHDPTLRLRATWGADFTARRDHVMKKALDAFILGLAFSGSSDDLLLCMAYLAATAPYGGMSVMQVQAFLRTLLLELVWMGRAED